MVSLHVPVISSKERRTEEGTDAVAEKIGREEKATANIFSRAYRNVTSVYWFIARKGVTDVSVGSTRSLARTSGKASGDLSTAAPLLGKAPMVFDFGHSLLSDVSRIPT